jgi:hypothetical protein
MIVAPTIVADVKGGSGFSGFKELAGLVNVWVYYGTHRRAECLVMVSMCSDYCIKRKTLAG